LVETKIGNYVWVGVNVCVQKGVNISDGVFIGSGALVAKDVSPYSIVVGNPAKLLRNRYDEETISLFLRIKWWDFP
jgi:virginiamycin A acetyltransferase